MSHIIKKQVIALTIDASLNGFQIQEMVSRHYWSVVVPMLEKIFDAIGGGDGVITVDRLEIDLGVFNEKNIRQEDWTAALPIKLEEMLAKFIHAMGAGTSQAVKSERTGAFGQWLFYMRHGYLPWNTMEINDAWHLHVLETLAVDYESVRTLRQLVAADTALLRRLVSLHGDTFLLRLAEIFTARKQTELPAVVNELVQLRQYMMGRRKQAGTHGEKEMRRMTWMQAMEQASMIGEGRRSGSLTALLVSAIVRPDPPLSRLPRVISEKLVHIAMEVNKIIDAGRAERRAEKIRIGKTVDKLERETGAQTAKEREITGKRDKKKTDPPAGEKPLDTMAGQESQPELRKSLLAGMDEEGIFVANAGVVLLHPFLHVLFGRLNWVADKKFKSLRNQQQALYLLHYLATGRVQAEEFELVIPKALCSYPLEGPVDPDIELSPQELAEADDMLTAAIQQWEILKSASHAALREGFLQRGGKLFVKNNGLYLQVESNSIDLLLDYLPWNLSMILLPWMVDILRVEWR